MKRILSLLLAAALCLALLPVQVLAENTEDPAETGITAPSEEEIVTPPAEDESTPAEDEEAAADLTFAQAFPDATFRTYVTETVLKDSTDSKDDSAVVSDAQWETIQSTGYIDVPNWGISSLEASSILAVWQIWIASRINSQSWISARIPCWYISLVTITS